MTVTLCNRSTLFICRVAGWKWHSNFSHSRNQQSLMSLSPGGIAAWADPIPNRQSRLRQLLHPLRIRGQDGEVIVQWVGVGGMRDIVLSNKHSTHTCNQMNYSLSIDPSSRLKNWDGKILPFSFPSINIECWPWFLSLRRLKNWKRLMEKERRIIVIRMG
jgi:hypothetical protein